MAELKTKLTGQPVTTYLSQIIDETRNSDCIQICKLMESVTKSPAKMWGNAIVGFGEYSFNYKNGKTANWFLMGFSPRKQNISLYISGCYAERNKDVLARLGKYKTSKSCLYIKSLDDINIDVLKELCEDSLKHL
ncbi:MAG: DUF1801 domain-containing protein [Bacteroidia bacterium]